jgi:hypothetical protein
VAIVTWANQPLTTVTNGGTDAPASGTAEQWTVSSGVTFPIASTSTTPATYFLIADTAVTSEIIAVTVATTASPWVWNVTRGAESTTPQSHASNFTVQQVVSAGSLQNFKQATSANTAPTTITNTTAETIIASYNPVTADLIPGTTFEAVAYGPFMRNGGTHAQTTGDPVFRFRWGSVTGTVLMTCSPGLSGNILPTTLAAGSSFDVNGTVTLLSASTAVSNLNIFWSGSGTSATTGSGQVAASSLTGTAISGSGPLLLTMSWSSASANFAMTVLTSIIYRAD